LVKTMVAFFHIVAALTHNECTRGCLSVGKTQGKYTKGRVYYYYDYFIFFRGWSVRCTR
jgi:hypothetical protein